MKCFFKLLIIFLYVIFSDKIYSQWQTDMRLTNDLSDSHTPSNTQRCIASNGKILHAVYHDNRNGLYNYEIYYKRSTDAGFSWSDDIRLTYNDGYSHFSSIAVSGSFVHIVWMEDRDGNYEIYYKRSTDDGITWGADTRLTNDTVLSTTPTVSTSGSDVNVMWFDERNGNFEIYFKRSSDGGVNWGVDTRITNNSALSYYPSVLEKGMLIHVIWQDFRDGNWEIYYKRSTDGGISWGMDSRLTNAGGESKLASFDVSGQNIYVSWMDNRDLNFEIYCKRSTDSGITWETDTRLTNNTAVSNFPSLSASGQTVNVVWEDIRDGNWEIYYKRSTNNGINWSDDTRLTNNGSRSENPFLCESGQAVNILWTDLRDGNFEIYFKKDPTGIPVGVINIGNIIPNEHYLAQNYPNPFNPSTNISFKIPYTQYIILKIYDGPGREVKTLVDQILSPGSYETEFSSTGSGINFASGIYFYKLSATGGSVDFVETKRMILLK